MKSMKKASLVLAVTLLVPSVASAVSIPVCLQNAGNVIATQVGNIGSGLAYAGNAVKLSVRCPNYSNKSRAVATATALVAAALAYDLFNAYKNPQKSFIRKGVSSFAGFVGRLNPFKKKAVEDKPAVVKPAVQIFAAKPAAKTLKKK